MEEHIYLSILTFPQRWENGKLYFNIIIIPRNLNPLLPLEENAPAFVDANIVFSTKIISSLSGLPILGQADVEKEPQLLDPKTKPNYRQAWEALRHQFELHDGIKISDDETNKPTQKATAAGTYKHIQKYLPISYRKAFNFVKPRTKYALTGDEYHCSIQNKTSEKDKSTQRDAVSWGKVVAYCLRNPFLAKKVGLLYEAVIDLSQNKEILDKGGWMYTELAQSGDFAESSKRIYAARIPALKNLTSRNLFSAIQFPVNEDPENNNSAAYDTIIREAIAYDDGFAKIVHASQPINQDPLQETDKSNPPLKDMGISLGWEDEQITIWYNRQMNQREEQTDLFVDAPLGVFGYRVDVREVGKTTWLSQNMVYNKNTIVLPKNNIEVIPANTSFEPGTEVHPASHGNARENGMWMPVYYTGWIGKPLSIADKDIEDINLLKSDTSKPWGKTEHTNRLTPKPTFHPYKQSEEHHLPLRYGENYEFRVRLMDISGGGPLSTDEPLNGGENQIENHHFKRHVGAGALKIEEIERFYNRTESPSSSHTMADPSILENIIDQQNSILHIKRPVLGYPAILFTGKYANPVELLKTKINSYTDTTNQKPIEIGLADPDVDSFQVVIEAKSLEMDNAASANGKESYIKLYSKQFKMPVGQGHQPYDESYELRVVYQDFDDVNLTETLPNIGKESANELILPTARKLRITFIPILSKADDIYADTSIHQGKQVVLTAYKPSFKEENLLSIEPDNVNAFYIRPDQSLDQNDSKEMLGSLLRRKFKRSKTPVELTRLADHLRLVSNNLTLEDLKGKRTQFACSKLIRHSLAPDSSSVTLSSVDELFNQWIIAIDFNIERDWAWDGLEVESFTVYRSWNVPVNGHSKAKEIVGKISISSTANINSLYGSDRSKTRVIFLDALDPKMTIMDFPREIRVNYSIEAHFKSGFKVEVNTYDFKELLLPVTIIPAQIPKLISAGIALTPYIADEVTYRYTEQRTKYLWFEFEEPIVDPFTTYQVRVLANSPDPMLCRMTTSLIEEEMEDAPIALDQEYIRHIIPGMADDNAGVGAMQKAVAEKTDSQSKSTIFIVPVPNGLHYHSDELFGFFTYEIRVGYLDHVWSTAQARFGRPLRVNGVQHPAPPLYCTSTIKNLYEQSSLGQDSIFLNKHEELIFNQMIAKEIIARKTPDKIRPVYDISEIAAIEQEFSQITNIKEKINRLQKRPELLGKKMKAKKVIVIKAPYAVAVHQGKNITANPPQTSLWYLLYTQVKQADGKSYRNLLIDSGILNDPDLNDQKENQTVREEGDVYGTAIVSLSDIKEKLGLIGLPSHSDLSVLVVEVFPMHNTWQGPVFNYRRIRGGVNNSHDDRYQPVDNTHEAPRYTAQSRQPNNPLTDHLGQYRIYRTSPLIPIDSGCCDDC